VGDSGDVDSGVEVSDDVVDRIVAAGEFVINETADGEKASMETVDVNDDGSEDSAEDDAKDDGGELLRLDCGVDEVTKDDPTGVLTVGR